MKLPRRRFLHLAAAAAALPVMSRAAGAQAYPTRPVRIVVGLTAGSASDIVARLVGGPMVVGAPRPAVYC
jgi:tripartite-type tricarboxylate transporter receptor subunit TctC